MWTADLLNHCQLILNITTAAVHVELGCLRVQACMHARTQVWAIRTYGDSFSQYI